jgi:hypothetical protein
MDWPLFSENFLAYRVKAFFLDRYQFLAVSKDHGLLEIKLTGRIAS